MLFSSVIFIAYFLPIFLVFYFACGARNSALLAGSILFYAWGEGLYVLLLLASVGGNFFAAHAIGRAEPDRRGAVLAWTVAADLFVLGIFKYAGAIVNTLSQMAGFGIPPLGIALPLGISFFTFQLISYLVDVRRNLIQPETSFFRFATYIFMFPHLIAGPIVRYADLVDELKGRTIRADRVAMGIQYFIVGLCQKMLIANTVAAAADHAFAVPATELDATTAWVGAFSYAIQIYFDFCGYSNMAIGLAFLLGFRFPKNFDYPYSARSITDFWRRWHISLSSWFRDYVFIPLGGSRAGMVSTLRNLLVVFFLTGLWHGAAWTFVAWGLFHGGFLILERLWLGKRLQQAPAVLSHAYTLVVVMVGWVLFRAETFGQAGVMLRAMFGFGATTTGLSLQPWITPEILTAALFGAILSFPLIPRAMRRFGVPQLSDGPGLPGSGGRRDSGTPGYPLPTPVLLAGLLTCLALLAANSLNPFLYFRF